MAYQEFNGELDQPTGFTEFTGTLDTPEAPAQPSFMERFKSTLDESLNTLADEKLSPALGTTLNALRGRTKQESVLQGAPMEAGTFDSVEADRLSRRDYAERQDMLKAQKNAPALRPDAGTSLKANTKGIIGRASDMVESQARGATEGLTMAGADVLSSVGALDTASTLRQSAQGNRQITKNLDAGIQSRNAADAVDPSLNGLQKFTGEYAPQILAQLPQIGVAMLSGGIAFPAVLSGLGSYADARERGLAPWEATKYAAAMGGMEAVGEKLGGMDKLAGAFEDALTKGFTKNAVRELGLKAVKSGIMEVPSEELTYVGQTGLSNLYDVNPVKGFGEFAKGAADTAIVSAGMGGMMGGAGAIAARATQPQNPQQELQRALADELNGGQFGDLPSLANTNPNLTAQPQVRSFSDPASPASQAGITPVVVTITPNPAAPVPEVSSAAGGLIERAIADKPGLIQRTPDTDLLGRLPVEDLQPNQPIAAESIAPVATENVANPQALEAVMGIPISENPAPVTQPAQPVTGEGAGGSQPTQVAPKPAAVQAPSFSALDYIEGLAKDAGQGFKTNDDAISVIKKASDGMTPASKAAVTRIINKFSSVQKDGARLIKPGFYEEVANQFAYVEYMLSDAAKEHSAAATQPQSAAPVTQQVKPAPKPFAELPDLDPVQQQRLDSDLADANEREYQQSIKESIQVRLGLIKPTESDQKKTPFKTFLRQYGIAPVHTSDIAGKNRFKANNVLPATFRAGGLDLDSLVERAIERGFMTEADRGDQGKLISMIQSEIAGDAQVSTEFADDDAAAQTERAQRMEIEGQADKLGLPYSTDTSTDQLASMVNRVQRRMEKEVDASYNGRGSLKSERVLANAREVAARIERKRAQYRRELAQFAEVVIAEQDSALEILTDDDGNPMIVRAADISALEQWLEENQQWDNGYGTDTRANQDSGQAGTPVAGSSQARAGDSAQAGPQEQRSGDGASDQGQEGSAGSSEGLTAPTRADIEAQQDQAEKAAKSKEAADRAADKAAAADEDRKRIVKASEAAADTFELGGNALDNLTGQGSMFEPKGDYTVDAPRKKYPNENQFDLFLSSEPDASQAGPAVEVSRRDAVAAVQDLHATGSVLAQTLSSDYAARQRTSLVGQTVGSNEDLAVLAQLYRDPRFETFRVVFTGLGGKVVSQIGLTSRLPGSTNAIVGNDLDSYLKDLSHTARQRGASGYYLLHNHPSGNPTPSRADQMLTKEFDARMPGLNFKGHVVIDTNQYSVIAGDGTHETFDHDFGQAAPMTSSQWGGVTFNGPQDVMAVARQMQVDDDAVTLIVTNSQYKVMSVATIPHAAITTDSAANKLMLTKAALQGKGSNLFAVGRNKMLLSRLSGSVMDAVYVPDTGTVASLAGTGAIGSGSPFPKDRRTRLSADTSPEFGYLRPFTMQKAKSVKVAEPSPAVKNLVTLHNLTVENLMHAADIGGIPVPSIGITKVDSPFGGFGEITLIAPKGLIDPANGVPVYDRDAYTARYPTMNFKKVTAKKADAFYDRVAKVRALGFDGGWVSQIWEAIKNASTQNPDKVWKLFQGYDAPRLLYATEVLGKTIKVPMRPVSVDFPWTADKQFAKTLASLKGALQNYASSEVEGSPEMVALSSAAREAIGRYVDKAGGQFDSELRNDLMQAMAVSWGDRGDWAINPDKPMPWKALDRIFTSAQNAGKMEVDRGELSKRLDKLVPSTSKAYADWAMGMINPLFDSPTITLRGKQVEPTLQNVVDAMTTGATAGAEETMTSGPGKIAAMLGKRFKSLAEIQAARDQVVPESVENLSKKATSVTLSAYRANALKFYTEKDWRGQIDTWGGSDAAMEALALAGKMSPTDGNIRMALQRKGFKGMDWATLDLARQSIEAIRSTATNYFEAKPQRAVKLNEFRGAVVPKGTSQAVLDVLAANGIEVATHNPKDPEARNKALEKLARKIDKGNDDVLFSRGGAVQTETPAFKAWFGDSKVVDEAGKPLVVYHSTNAISWEDKAGFSEFDTKTSELGSHFGTAEQANSFGNGDRRRLMPVLLSIKNPLRLKDYGEFSRMRVPFQLEALGLITTEKEDALRDMPEANAIAEMQRVIEAAGFDGVVYLNRREGAAQGSLASNGDLDEMTDGEILEAYPEARDSYIAFSPTQIKSAIGNNGNFNPANPDIRYKRTQSAPSGQSVADTQAQVNKITAKQANGPRTIVVATPADLPVDAPSDARGMYLRGTVYIVASNNVNAREVASTLAHETIAHHGLRNMLGRDDWLKLMGNIQLALASGNKPLNAIRAELRKSYVDENGVYNLNKNQESDEISARAVEDALDANGEFKPGFGFMKSVYAKLAQFLRDIGINVKFTNLELQGMLVSSLGGLQTGARTNGVGVSGAPVYSRSPRTSQEAAGQADFDGETETFARGRSPQAAPRAPGMKDESKFMAVRRTLQDQFIQVRELQDMLTARGGVVGEAQDVYRAEERMHGRAQELLTDFANNQVQPLMTKIAQGKVELDELSLYAYALHAKERNAYIESINPKIGDAGSGMSNDEADSIIQMAQASGNQAKFDELHQDLMGITATTRRVLLDEGLITQDEYDGWDGLYDNYVPLRGFENVTPEGNPRPGVSRGFSTTGKESIKALGRTSKAGDILENIIRDYERAVIRSEKNSVSKVFLDLALNNPDPDLWEIQPVKVSRSFNKAAGMVLMSTTPDTGDETIAIKVGGQQVRVKIKDPLILRAMKLAAKDETSQLERMLASSLGAYTNLMRNTLTRYNPVFGAINAVRDVQMGAVSIFDELGAEGFKLYAKYYTPALSASFRKERNTANAANPMDKWMMEMRFAGGTTGGFHMRDVSDITDSMRTMMLAAGAAPNSNMERIRGSKGYQGAAAAMKWLEVIGSTSEDAARLAAYRAARELGKTPAEAASIAKNLTTNFNRKGEWGTTLNSLYLFFNAGVQGTTRVLEALQNRRVQYLMSGVTAAAMAIAIANAGAGDDDDGQAYWDKIPAFEKERNLIFMLPAGVEMEGAKQIGTRGRYIKIPMPYGLNVFPVLGNQLADLARYTKDRNQGASPAKAAINMVSAVFGSINPFGGGVDLTKPVEVGMAMAPTAADLAIQLMTGSNAFGRPVGPEKSPFDDRPDSENFSARQAGGASQYAARWLNSVTGGNEGRAGMIDVMPGTLDNVVRNATGGLGVFLADTFVNLPSKMVSPVETTNRDIPLWRNFYGQIDEVTDIGLFYDRRAEATKEMKQAQAEMKMGIKVDYSPESKFMQTVGSMAENYTNGMTDYRKREVEIAASKTMTRAEKMVKRQDLEVQRAKLARSFNTNFVKYEHAMNKAKDEKAASK